jgi:predicted lipoprotein with Yx(FWY)xxD motif
VNPAVVRFVVPSEGQLPATHWKKETVKKNLTVILATSALAMFALAGCSSPTTATPPAPEATASAAQTAELAVADSSLGQIVVDGTGMTAYVFDKDAANSGTSACAGQCATLWPAITTTSDTPTVDGVTGTVGTIPTADGGKQITINGLPIYTYSADSAAGDVTGQGFGGVWWTIAPSGDKISTPAASSDGY